ncbi:hypothetical protein J2D73_19970 [Acetobacter sacchari]|uniref:Uncharacterized protein n=1 Tax=Acetobacter sacchari TaxID=2661687 RepID=A0ABS3M1K2_9PROT|nr:hypothetical protein [Acetobacter sacchari]MBO1362062.1 hypothetical protein [Acetobacter sacchari]
MSRSREEQMVCACGKDCGKLESCNAETLTPEAVDRIKGLSQKITALKEAEQRARAEQAEDTARLDWMSILSEIRRRERSFLSTSTKGGPKASESRSNAAEMYDLAEWIAEKVAPDGRWRGEDKGPFSLLDAARGVAGRGEVG